MKDVLLLSSSPRKKGNSRLLCEQFAKGAVEAGHTVHLIQLAEKNIGFCRACDYCMNHGGVCVLRDDMEEILPLFQKADVLVLATPIYFYGICARMKNWIDRVYPIWQTLERKDVYYIISAGLGEDIINRSLKDLDGFVEHMPGSTVCGRIYATHAMEAGAIQETSLPEQAYQMGLKIGN